jgi:purine-binding chemotaxis protein CheW
MTTCVVVLDVPHGAERMTVGALVDAVQEVLEFDSSLVQPPPRLGTAVKPDLLKGIGKRDERFVMILDISRVLADERMKEPGGGMDGSPPAG